MIKLEKSKFRYLIVILGLSACLCFCGKNDTKEKVVERTNSTGSISSKEENVVEDMTCSSLLLGGIELSIPSCFGEMDESISTETNKYYYAEKVGYPPMLMISYSELAVSQEEFNTNKDKLVDGFFNSFESVHIKDTKDILIDDLSGITVTATGSLSGIEMEVWVSFVYNIYEQKSIVIAFSQLPDTEYDYIKPYESIIQNVVLQSEKVIPETIPSTEIPKETPATEDVTPELKQFLDDYEAFINEYVEFMKNYNNSTDTISMITDYANIMTKYSEFMSHANDINTDELSPADLEYYIEVTNRCSVKMLELTQ